MAGLTLGLSRITALLRVLGSPHLSVPCVHVAGTNGKGSVSAFLDSILRSSGFNTGRFNSPHFLSVHDSILLNGAPIQETMFKSLREEVDALDRQHHIQASPFELLTATAFLAFSRSEPPLDVAVLEVGVGGGEDATNVIPTPLLCIITPVDLDHQAILGDTLRDIAQQKAGIIKRGRPVIVASQQPDAQQVILDVACQQGSPVKVAVPAEVDETPFRPTGKPEHRWSLSPSHEHVQLNIPLSGPHQLENAGTALTAADELRTNHACIEVLPQLASISDNHLVDGIQATTWPGRLQWLNAPLPSGQRLKLLADGAHNPASAQNLRAFVDSLATSSPQPGITWIIGCSAPREPDSLLQHLVRPQDTLIACEFTTMPAGMPWVKPTPADHVAAAACDVGLNQVYSTPSISEALRLLEERQLSPSPDRNPERGPVVLAGSLYLVADLYRLEGIEVH